MEQRLRYLREQIATAEDERAALAAEMLNRELAVREMRKMNQRIETRLRACIATAAREIAKSPEPEFTWIAMLRERVRSELFRLANSELFRLANSELFRLAKGPRQRG